MILSVCGCDLNNLHAATLTNISVVCLHLLETRPVAGSTTKTVVGTLGVLCALCECVCLRLTSTCETESSLIDTKVCVREKYVKL